MKWQNSLRISIHNELSEYSLFKYWRTTGKAEVDFIMELDGKIIPVEVKSFGSPGRSFRSFIDHYRPESGVFAALFYLIFRFAEPNT